MTKAAVLSSGYVTRYNSSLVYEEPVNNPYTEHFLNKRHLSHESEFYHDPDSEALYVTMLRNNSDIKTIDNRMNAICVYKSLIGARGLSDWIELQRYSPFISAAHMNFIEDTIKFISGENKVRKIDIGTWQRVVTVDTSNSLSSINKDSYIDELLSDCEKLTDNTTDLLILWLSRPNGYVDLVSTLYIICGPKNSASRAV